MNDFVAPPNPNIPPEIDIQSGASLTIGTTFDMSADSILKNLGTVNVGTKLELLDDATNPVTPVNKSVVTNSGTINLGQGGDIQGLASLTNSGTIDLKGGTLNVQIGIANTDGVTGGSIILESGSKVVLGTDTSTGGQGGVTGGTVTVKAGGELDLTGSNSLNSETLTNSGQVNVSGTANVLSAEIVANTGTMLVENAARLQLTNATTINDTGGGTLTNHGEIESVVGINTIKNAASFTSDGLIEVVGSAGASQVDADGRQHPGARQRQPRQHRHHAGPRTPPACS